MTTDRFDATIYACAWQLESRVLIRGDRDLAQSRLRRPSALQVVTVLLVGYLILQVVLPLGSLLFSSFKDVRPADAGFLSFEFTLDNFRSTLSDRSLWATTLTTTVYAGASSLLATMIGAYLAWVTTRTNAWWRGALASIVLYQLAIPDVLSPIVWNFLLGEQIGYINVLWRDITGASGPLLNVQSLAGMIWVQAFLLVPWVYLFAVPALGAMDRSLEDAALMSGASRASVFRDVTLKLAAPALFAIMILVSVRSWESFEVPWYLGVPVRLHTYATQIYFRTITPPSDTGMISAYAVPMLTIAFGLVLIYGRFNKKAGQYATVSGKSYRSDPPELATRPRILVSASAWLIVGVGIVLPFLMLVWLSVLPFYRPPSIEALSVVSTDSFVRVLARNDRMLRAFANSTVIGVGASVIVVIVSTLSAWLVLRTRQRGRSLVDLLTFLPMSIPNIIVGVCFLWIYALAPAPLRGSHLGVILAYVTLLLAVGARNVYARMHQLHPELDEAARVSGASTLAMLRTVTVPGLAPALIATFLFVIIGSFKELPTALLLTSASSRTAAAFLFDMSTVATIGQQAAVGLTIVAFEMILITIFQWVSRRHGVRGF